MEPGRYEKVETLRDGLVVTIRAIQPDDRERFVNAFHRFIKSPASARSRFHGLKQSISDKEAVNMTDIDFAEHVGLVAICGPEQGLIGACRYILCHAPKRHRAEVAFAVLDEYQGKALAHCSCSISPSLEGVKGCKSFWLMCSQITTECSPFLSGAASL
jgi:hypothetical protein